MSDILPLGTEEHVRLAGQAASDMAAGRPIHTAELVISLGVPIGVGTPRRLIPGVLIWPAAAWEIGGGILLLTGLWIRPLSILLAGWCLLTASIFHTAFGDPIQMVHFLKNMTMAGGFLILARAGAPGLGFDGKFSLAKGL